MEQSFRYTKDNQYKIRAEGKDYLIGADSISLLSKATKASSK